MVVGCFRRCSLEDSLRVTYCWCVSSMGFVLRAGPLDGEEYGCVLAVPLPMEAPHFQRICGRSSFPCVVDASFLKFWWFNLPNSKSTSHEVPLPSSLFSIQTLRTMFISVGGRVEEGLNDAPLGAQRCFTRTLEKLPFALWAYRTSFRTSTGATPYSLVYEWAQARFDQLNLLDERRLRAADHVQAYQRKMARAFKKRVKPRPLQKGDLVLRILRGLIGDPRGKFRPSWSGPYVIRELTPEGAAWLTDLDGNQFSEPTNVDQLKKYYV
uniref:Uncharacterized protein n=1 Tax=Vitis vinifera TaxID=29760 RepID=A5AWJ0_VITVI|nr:hypothetical protein VITISV_031277 [Vitis vinifera]